MMLPASTPLWAALLLMPAGLSAQATTISAPPEPSLLHMFVRPWARESALGDLVTVSMPDSALELRFWGGFGLFGTRGLVLQRSPAGEWTARRAVVEGCAVVRPFSEQLTPARIDSLRRRARESCSPDSGGGGQVIYAAWLSLYALELPPDPEAVWRDLLSAGLLTLPPRVERTWIMNDGHTFVLELRRGHEYRASEIEYLEKPEHPADATIRRVADVLTRYYRWDRP
ncbi:MAG: hypothetical protein ACREAA_02295 [Candidatus Polarisedimenticolia bacterium]